MKLSQFKNKLNEVSELNFIQPNGIRIPQHFHITEAGLTTKHFIDCGGTVRTEKIFNFQIWVAGDVEHRLVPGKLQNIISISEKIFGKEDLEVEIEYQNDTIGRYGLKTDGTNFLFTTKETDCLAKENCKVPQEKQLISEKSACCTPGGGCC